MCSRAYTNSKAVLCGDPAVVVVPKKILGLVGLAATTGAFIFDGLALVRLLLIHRDHPKDEEYFVRQTSGTSNGTSDNSYWAERLTRSTYPEIVRLLAGKLLPHIQKVLVFALQTPASDSRPDQGFQRTSRLMACLGSHSTVSLAILLLCLGLSNYCSFSLAGDPTGGFKPCVLISCWISLVTAGIYLSCTRISIGEMLGASLPFAMSVGASFGIVFDRIFKAYQECHQADLFLDEEKYAESKASAVREDS